jgi:methyl acetate hydrolase
MPVLTPDAADPILPQHHDSDGEEAMANLPQVDRVLREAVERGDVPGIVAMAATRDGPVYEGAFGRRALPDGAPMTADTVFWIASMTKAITSTAAMQLVEAGRLALDRPVADVLPELAAPLVLEGFDMAGEPRLRPARRPITLRHLLTHTAGFVYDIWSPDMVRYMQKTGIPGIISCENAALDLPLVFDPGDKWDYGINIDWVGKAVERVSGKKLGDYFAEHLFAPLGITDTGFKLTAERRGRLAAMHMRGADGGLAPIPFELPPEPEFEMGGGGLYGTAADYLAFARLFVNEGRAGGKAVLKPETVRLMAQNAIGELDVRFLKTAVPEYSNDAEFFPGMVKKWGLGFMISTAPVAGGRSAGSLAWAGLGNTFFWIDPLQGVAGVILMQLIPFADAKALAAFDAFEKALYAALA